MASTSSNETIIAQGVKVEGDFRANGNVIIDGEVNGSIQTEQSLRIGEAAIIQANVSAMSAVVAGHVKGNILAQEKLELLASCVVDGDIQTTRISVAEGAQLNGKIIMGANTRSRGKKSSEKVSPESEQIFEEEPDVS